MFASLEVFILFTLEGPILSIFTKDEEVKKIASSIWYLVLIYVFFDVNQAIL